MKKRISALIICCVIGSALLAGCGEEASVQLDKENAIKYTMEELYADIGHDEDKAKTFVGDNTYEIIVFLPSEVTKNISKGDTITVYGIVTGSSIGSMSRVQLLLDNAELKE